jgi:hypothetical protein
MGLGDLLKRKALKHELGDEGMNKLTAFVTWLNAVPGRKRGIGFALVGLAAAFQAAGKAQWAQGVTTANDWIQTQLVPGMDIVGGLIGVWGLIHPFFEGHASNVKVSEAS